LLFLLKTMTIKTRCNWLFKTNEEAIGLDSWQEKFLEWNPGLKENGNWMLEKLGISTRKISYTMLLVRTGKGSTLRFLRNMLEANGQTVGTFTISTILRRSNERISVNGVPISDERNYPIWLRVYLLAYELEKLSWMDLLSLKWLLLMIVYLFWWGPFLMVVWIESW